MPDPKAVRSMFARISGRYDLLNRTLSMGIDQRWRRRTLRAAGDVRGKRVADVCCGTGDLAIAFEKAGARVVGVDFTPEMLHRALPKRAPAPEGTLFVHGDAMRLPMADSSVDVASVAFGIRNVADRVGGMAEMARVLRPGGRLLVLEFTTPRRGPIAWAYRFYFTRVLPWIGRRVSGDGDAYDYLPRTVLAWPRPEELQQEMEGLGLEDCGHKVLTFGIACLHWGHAPSPEGRP